MKSGFKIMKAEKVKNKFSITYFSDTAMSQFQKVDIIISEKHRRYKHGDVYKVHEKE